MEKANRLEKNHFYRNLCLSIMEIISIMPPTIICGIIACVFSARANCAYLEGRYDDSRNYEKKTAAVLVVGGILWFTAAAAVVIACGRLLPAETKLAGYNTFLLEGKEITLPVEYEEFETLGFEVMDPEFAETHMVNPGDSAYVSLVKEDDRSFDIYGSVFVRNPGDEPVPFHECVVHSIRVYDMASMEFGHGFNMSSSEHEMTAYYGKPDDGYFPRDNPGYRRYQWRAPSYEDNRIDQLEVLFEGGTVTEVIISYWGEEDQTCTAYTAKTRQPSG